MATGYTADAGSLVARGFRWGLIPRELLHQRPVAQALRLAGVLPGLVVMALHDRDASQAHVRGGIGGVKFNRLEEQGDGGRSFAAEMMQGPQREMRRRVRGIARQDGLLFTDLGLDVPVERGLNELAPPETHFRNSRLENRNSDAAVGSYFTADLGIPLASTMMSATARKT